jgi:hypothetical protein
MDWMQAHLPGMGIQDFLVLPYVLGHSLVDTLGPRIMLAREKGVQGELGGSLVM